jgi:hypothetical protein
MASKLLGRVACPVGCGHAAAFVKIKTDKEGGREAFPYVHCPACGVQLHTRSDEQARHLLTMTRPEQTGDGAEPPTAPPAARQAARAPDPVPLPQKAPASAGGLFGGIFGGVPA